MFFLGLYFLPLGQVIAGVDSISYHFFADDSQLCYSFKQHVHSALILLIGCLSAVKDWLAGLFFF